MTAALALERHPTMTPPQPPPSLSMEDQLLAALPSAVDCARRFVRYTLEQWRLHNLIDTAEIVVAELIGDAVAATGIVIEHPSYLDLYDKQLTLVDLRLQRLGTRVLIEVWDTDPTPPWPREPAPGRAEASSPRAAARVQSRTYYLPPPRGKVVRVELEIPPDGSLEDTQELALPRRAGRPHRQMFPAPARPVEIMTNPVLLQRVLDGLRQLDTDEPPGDEHTTNPNTTREDR